MSRSACQSSSPSSPGSSSPTRVMLTGVFFYPQHFSEASERCQAEKRKTINGEDILFAMSTLGFDNYVEPLKLYLQKYREAMKGERQIESELTTLGGDVMTAQQLQSLATTEGDVLLTYTNGQQFQL